MLSVCLGAGYGLLGGRALWEACRASGGALMFGAWCVVRCSRIR